MKLIREEIESVKFLVETAKSGKKSMYIEGVFLQGNIKNRNGRMYPMETLRREVARYNENHVVSGRALGELGHPDGPTVNLDRVSHKIVSLKESGSNFIGKAKILSTPMGKIAGALVEEGVKLGVSSRGIGSLKMTREGVNIVGDDFMLATAADIVADPSAPDAFVEGIMEGKEWVWEGTLLREKKAEEIKNSEIKINAKDKYVVVIGGGDTGSDCIGTSFRQGAKKVTQLEIMPMPPKRENKELTWPYWPHKLRTSSSQEEGAVRDWSVMTKSFKTANGKVKGLECIKLDSSLKPIKNSEFFIKADLVLLAMGFVHPKHDGLISQSKLKKDEKGNLLADTKNYLTSDSSIYAAGDARRGQSLVVWAIREGREAASAIHSHLSS